MASGAGSIAGSEDADWGTIVYPVAARYGRGPRWWIRKASLGELLAAHRSLELVEAREALGALPVADFPHLDQKGRDATLGTLQQAAGFNRGDSARYDARGRLIIDSYEAFMAWSSDNALVGVVAA